MRTKRRIPFTKPFISGREMEYIQDLVDNRLTLSGDGKYTKKVHALLQEKYNVKKVFLTTSASTALEYAVRLCELKAGDEVIVPSFTFPSTANAVLTTSNANIVFADVDSQTLNIDPDDVERKITPRTRAIIVVHYAGICCDMDRIMDMAKRHNILVIEDAAQAIGSTYKGRFLGTIGHFGCISFHETKNIICGEGGALFLNTDEEDVVETAEILREKGTNRTKFLLGLIDKYTWVDIGGSYLSSDILAAFLYAQLENADLITEKRKKTTTKYYNALAHFEKNGLIRLPIVPIDCVDNGHMFYMLFNENEHRNFMMKYLKKYGIQAVFHYIPLHSSPMGRRLGYRPESLPVSEKVSDCLLRLPLFPDMSEEDITYVLDHVKNGLKQLKKTVPPEKYENPWFLKQPKITLTIGIAAYNEEQNIATTIAEIMKQRRDGYILKKIIVISDGSTDNTVKIVRSLKKKNPLIKLIDDKTNRGKLYRINQLFSMVKTDALLNLDGDIGLVGDKVIANGVKMLQTDRSAQLIAIHQEPLCINTLFGRLLWSSFKLWDYVRLSVPGYKTVHNLYGAATLYRGSFARTLKYPEGCHDERSYLYFMADRMDGFRYLRDAEIIYWPPTTFSEWVSMTERPFGKPSQVLIDMFGEHIYDNFEIPRKYVILGTIKAFIHDPFYTPMAILMGYVMSKASKVTKQAQDGKFQVSNKLAIPS